MKTISVTEFGESLDFQGKKLEFGEKLPRCVCSRKLSLKERRTRKMRKRDYRK